jgi:hypothetical protein
MNLLQLNKTLKSTPYTLPKVNYDFLQKVVINCGNSDIAITGRLCYDQYKLAKKLLHRNLCKTKTT